MIDIDKQQKSSEAPHRDAAGVLTPQATAPLVEGDAARWANNIFIWSSYLPHDCVKSMIQMGWHHST
jgi:hypothetical protein